MSDNVVINSMSGGDTVAADDIGGIKHQRVKVEFGSDGSATDVSSSNPLPISQGFAIPTYDYIAVTTSSTSDVYTYKTGGSGGTTVATITVIYTDSTKATIVSVTKT